MKFFSPKYNFFHGGYDQLLRQQRALNLKMDSVKRKRRTGTIKDYDVTLNLCTCPDFKKRHKPCKHMYRLAFELKVFKLDAEKIEAQLAVAPKVVNAYFKPEISYHSPVPKKFVVIDFETANQYKESVCQMGIAVVENDSIVATENFLIRPPYEHFSNTRIHGITFDDVKDSPTFPELWPQIKNFIEGQVVAAYNARFDLKCLVSVLKFYQIPVPNFAAFDILENVRECSEEHKSKLSHCINHQLVTVAKELGFAHDAHDALSDAVVAAQVQLWMSEKFPKDGTLVSFTSIFALIECFEKENISLKDILNFCKFLLKSDARFSDKKREEFFTLLEVQAARCENAALYKFCGKFYDERNEIPRALELYRKAFSLDSKSGVKTRIQTLERTL